LQRSPGTSGGSTIAAGFASGLIDFAARKGVRREELVTRSGLDPERLRDPDDRIPFASYAALMRTAIALSGDAALALRFGEEVDLSEMSILGSVGGVSTMQEGLAAMTRYAPLAVDFEGQVGERMQIRRIRGRTWLVDTRPDPNEFPEFTESAFARMVCGARRWLGGMEWARAMRVTHPEPPYRAEYDRIFRMPISFESAENALLLAEDALTRRVPHTPRYVSDVFGPRADDLLEGLERARTTRGRVERLLAPTLPTGGTSMAAVGRRLGVSRQTLFRRLKAEGVTFERVLEELRLRTALRCLNEESLSVKETAYRVGFSEPAAFSRAFKRWTGSRPRAARVKRSSRGC
jgi:AraC-like DNA-binding protein